MPGALRTTSRACWPWSGPARAFKEVRGALPVNLVYLFEGEEEMGSPHLEEWVLNNQDLCQCDASIGLDGGVHRTSYKPEIHLGIKAILVVELRVKTHEIDFWSGRAQLMQAKSAPWRLVHCLEQHVRRRMAASSSKAGTTTCCPLMRMICTTCARN